MKFVDTFNIPRQRRRINTPDLEYRDGPLDTQCLVFLGSCQPDGYGHIWHEGRLHRAHALAWVATFGPVDPGLCVLHRCDNPPCVNVEHLFVGTDGDNAADRTRKGRGSNGNKGKTHCKHGHEFTEANTYVNAKGERACRPCRNRRHADRRAARAHR